MAQKYDIISIAAHPDDVEVGTGSILIRMADLGYRTGLLNFTRGETGAGGNPEKSRNYFWFLGTMARLFGQLVGVKHGQGFRISEPPKIMGLFCMVRSHGDSGFCSFDIQPPKPHNSLFCVVIEI